MSLTYAIVETGGKQYRVSPGDVLKVEKLEGQPGDTVELDRVLMISDDQEVKVGNPTIPGASVEATIKNHGKDKKVIVFKFKNKTNYQRFKGHRQPYSEIEILSVKY
jgi:large subunit ribosomal protein L21